MSTATLPMNGKPRKQLSDQLDRLDNLIDVLGDGLNDAVVTAMRAGSKQAVKEALVEVLMNPDFLSALQSSTTATNAPSRPSLWSRFKCGVAKLRTSASNVASWIRDRFRKAASETAEKIRSVCYRGTAMLAVAHSGGIYLRRLALTATVVGILTGMVAFVTPHELLAIAGAVGSAVFAAAAQVVYRARNVIRSLISMSFPLPAAMPT